MATSLTGPAPSITSATAERPDYTIVGGFTYNPEKAGQDIGTVAGTAPLGVALTNDRAAILALEADCVLFLAGAENDVPGSIADICALLESGKNVVTTAANFIYPKSLGPEVEAALAARDQARTQVAGAEQQLSSATAEHASAIKAAGSLASAARTRRSPRSI